MTSLRGSTTHQPVPSASQPPSPLEEDLAKASAWDDEDTSTLVSPKWKGKGKQRDEEDEDEDGTVDGEDFNREVDEYPPMAEEDLESRKIEENLKRWETLEKQRRKKARETRSSIKSHSPSSSFSVTDVSRRASQLWSGRSRERPKTRPNHTHPHQVLEDADESLPVDKMGPPSASSPTNTPRTSTADIPRQTSVDTSPESRNPFENPQYAEGAREPDALMTAAGADSLPSTPKGTPNGEPERPILQVHGLSYSKHPPPQPLGLPAPSSPPPPPGAVPQRQQQLNMEEFSEEGKGKRWWTEWLCGCREDGDNQAGRTNPME